MIAKLLPDAWGIPQLVMEHYGYRAIAWDQVQNYHVTTIQDDGYRLEIEWEQLTHFVRNVPVMAVGSDIVAQSLNSQGIYAYVNANVDTRIEYTDLVLIPNHLVAFAKEIKVNGTPVNWLLYDSERRMSCEGPWDGDPILVTTLSPLDFYRAIDRNDPDTDLYVSLVIWLLDRYGDVYEYATFEEDGQYVIETTKIADELLQNTLELGAPELVRKDRVRNALGEFVDRLTAARSKLWEAKDYMRRIVDSGNTNLIDDELRDLVRDMNDATVKVFDAVDKLEGSTCETVMRLTQEVDAAFLQSPSEQK
jgi:hypothetical protein